MDVFLIRINVIYYWIRALLYIISIKEKSIKLGSINKTDSNGSRKILLKSSWRRLNLPQKEKFEVEIFHIIMLLW